jgi:phenylacetate-coenzyme A ligase PaaK-like adenylate-forming protein
VDRSSFYKNYYESLNFGLRKIYMFLNYLSSLSRKAKDIKEVLPVKGLICSGHDSRIYYKLIENNFGVKPLNMYGSSELGFPMYGTVEDKYNMILDLRVGYFEFIDIKTGEVLEVDELKKEHSYSLVGTPFGSSIVRYRIGDIFKVKDLRDDGMPVFSFEGREGYVIDIYDYFRVNEDLATRVMMKSGLTSSENWVFAKLTDPYEHLCILMEKEQNYTEKLAAEIIFKAFLEESEDFRIFVRDFKIKNPTDVIKVEYLKKGAFIRYAESRLRKGMPYGQVKPPKVIPSNKMEIFEIIRRI